MYQGPVVKPLKMIRIRQCRKKEPHIAFVEAGESIEMFERSLEVQEVQECKNYHPQMSSKEHLSVALDRQSVSRNERFHVKSACMKLKPEADSPELKLESEAQVRGLCSVLVVREEKLFQVCTPGRCATENLLWLL